MAAFPLSELRTATTWAIAAGILGVPGLLATLIPAYRATRVNPIIAIQAE